MKILWLTNIMLPQVAEQLQYGKKISCGWLTQLADLVADNSENEFYVVFPQNNGEGAIQGVAGNIHYFSFFEQPIPMTQYDISIENRFKDIINQVKPDIVHIWGTEYIHSLAMVKAFHNPEKTIISIQGLVSIYAQHYMADLPRNIQTRYTLRDILRQDNLVQQQMKYAKRGAYEIEAIKSVNYVIGRTDWDQAATAMMNPNVKYYKCNEILRRPFYENEWKLENCERHTLFVSSAAYPIKGFHYVVEALNTIVKQYSDVKLYVAGNDILKQDGWKAKLKISSYAKYVRSLIMRYGLEDHIEFLGMLNENQMCEQYKKAHVFISAASIENSPNSLGEAMIMGTPCVASDVGGVKNLMQHEKEGFIYQHNATYMLAYYIQKLFENDELSCDFSHSARNRANETHHIENTLNQYIETYKNILY